MKNIIEINGIKGYAFHGCLDEEESIGGHYVVDVVIETNFMEAAIQDDLSKTIDYVGINKICREELAIRSKLIEQVGYRIYNKIKSTFSEITKLTVKVIKIAPPINGDVENVAIIISE